MRGLGDVIHYSGEIFPFGDQSFDAVFHTEVLEHVADYRVFLRECFRVLKPGQEMMFTVPFQARFHFIPIDYWRFTESGLVTILRDAGLEPLRVSARGTDLAVAAYKVVSVFYRFAHGGIFGKAIFIAFSWLVVLLLCVAHVCMIFGLGSSDDCLGYSVVAVRPNP
jgi:SAM-dependent methyltransferase